MQVILHQKQGRVNVRTNGEVLKVCFVEARRLCAGRLHDALNKSNNA